MKLYCSQDYLLLSLLVQVVLGTQNLGHTITVIYPNMFVESYSIRQ